MLPNIEEVNPDFIALDVETANEDYWSICQVGLVYFKDGKVVDTWATYVNPETYFDDINISIHGITEESVRDAIKLIEMYDLIANKISGSIVAHHLPFDRVSFHRCAEHLNKAPIDCKWLDTGRIARRTWEEVKASGYSLINLSKMLDIKHEKPHDALDDAMVAGNILLKAIETSGVPLNDWTIKAFSKFRLWDSSDKKFRDIANADPDPNGSLYGEVVVFTGALSITRLEAGQLAYQMGCNIDEKITRNTTMLVVGDQDTRKLAGYSKSSKHRKAEELIVKGQPIRIMGEDDFKAMIDY